jgi:protein ImuA
MNTPVPIAVVAALRERIRCLDGGARYRRAVLPFGIKAIDERLPEGGLALGALHEVAGGGNGVMDGAAAALFAAGIAARTRGRVLWCVTRQDLFAPALALAGLAPDRVIYVEAGDEKSLLACFEEGLRHGGSHGGLGAVVAEVARLSMTASRRLQLAAEGSGAIGIAVRRLPYMRGRDTASRVIARERACEEFGRSIGRSVLLLPPKGGEGDPR